MGFRVVAINIADGGPVLNCFCARAEIKTSCFFFFVKRAFEQFVMPPKKKIKADRHTADVESGFSAHNLICTSQRSRLTAENQDMLLWVEILAPRDVEGSIRVGCDEDDRQIGCNEKEDVIP